MKSRTTMVVLALSVLGTVIVAWNLTRGEGDPHARTAAREAGEMEVVPAAPAPGEGERKGGAGAGRNGEPVKVMVAGGDERKPPLRGAPTKGPPPAAAMVTGVVRLAGGADPAGVKVTLRPNEGGEKRETQTDPAGSFRFDHVEPGRYALLVLHAGYARSHFVFDVRAEEGAGPFDLLLNRGGAIKVKMEGPYGAPLEGEVVYVQTQSTRTFVFDRKTDRDGVVLIDNLLPGAYDVKNLHGGMAVADAIAGKTAEVVFKLACGIRGTVIGPDGKPLAEAYLYLNPVVFDKGYRAVHGRTDKDGRYELSGFPEGEYNLRVQVVSKEESYVTLGGRVRVLTGQTLDYPVRIDPTRLLGRVTVGESGVAPKERMHVQATPVEQGDDGKLRTLGTTLQAFANAEGRYSFVGLRPGLYRLWVPPLHGYAEIVRLYDFAAGGEQRVDIRLKKMQLGTVVLQILEPDGSPASGLQFGLARAEDGWTHTAFAKSVGPGRFKLELEVGPRVLQVIRVGIAETRLELDVVKGKPLERTVKLVLEE